MNDRHHRQVRGSLVHNIRCRWNSNPEMEKFVINIEEHILSRRHENAANAKQMCCFRIQKHWILLLLCVFFIWNRWNLEIFTTLTYRVGKCKILTELAELFVTIERLCGEWFRWWTAGHSFQSSLTFKYRFLLKSYYFVFNVNKRKFVSTVKLTKFRMCSVGKCILLWNWGNQVWFKY